MSSDIVLNEANVEIIGDNVQLKTKPNDQKTIEITPHEINFFGGNENKKVTDINGIRGVIRLRDPGSSQQTYIDHRLINSNIIVSEKLDSEKGQMEEFILGGGAVNSEDPVSGKLEVRDDGDSTSIRVDGNDARIDLGKQGGNDGDVVVHNKDGKETIHLGGNDARLELGHEGGGNDGDVFVHDKDGNRSIHLGGNDARLELGQKGGNDGDVFVNDNDGNRSIHLGGEDARISLGHQGGDDGDVFVHDKNGNRTIHLNGANGKVSAKTVDTRSDVRCKEDLEPIGEVSEKLSQLRGVSFRWKEESCGSVGGGSGRSLGLIAQEVKEVLPEVVSQDDEGYYSVAYGQIVPVVVEALKEQQETIDELRAENEKLQQALDAAEERVERLESMEERLTELEERLESQPV
jgi:hypothetical protein